MVKICAVCQKNGWRSPLFQGLMQDLTNGRTDVEFTSAGLYVIDSPRELKIGLTHERLEQLGVRLPKTDIHQLTQPRVDETDLMIAFHEDLVISIGTTLSNSVPKVIEFQDLKKYRDDEVVAEHKWAYDETWNRTYPALDTQENQYWLREAFAMRDARDSYLRSAVGLLAVLNREVAPTEPVLIALQAKMTSSDSGERPRLIRDETPATTPASHLSKESSLDRT